MGKNRDALKRRIDALEQELITHATSVGVGFEIHKKAKQQLLNALLKRPTESDLILKEFGDVFKNNITSMGLSRAASATSETPLSKKH